MEPSHSSLPTSPAIDGFSLIELVAVLGVIAVLSSIAFSVLDGVRERSVRSRSRSELAAIGSALESYRIDFGSYPIIDSGNSEHRSRLLLAALTGCISPDGNVIVGGRSYLDIGSFPVDEEGHCFVDGWGNPLYYAYSETPTWPVANYYLISAGPDGVAVWPSKSGVYDATIGQNLDNLEGWR